MKSWLRLGKSEGAQNVRPHYGVKRLQTRVEEKGVPARVVTFENYSLDELVEHLAADKGNPAMHNMLQKYRFTRTFPDMSNFRMGPNMFDNIPLDWIVFSAIEGGRNGDLVAHGIATRVQWNGDSANLPRGWTGAVRQSYEDTIVNNVRPNTLVGLFILAEQGFREHGWAARVTQEMKRIGAAAELDSLIIPLRLPTRYEHQNARVPYHEFALLKREDGQYRDHWLRMHVRLGAEVIGISAVSHQHALHPYDLDQQLQCGIKDKTGEYLVRWNEEYYNVYVDVEREFAVMNQGCVWVRHALR